MNTNPEWKPIASAPKDGSEILVFHPEGGVCAAFCPGDGFAWHCMDGMNTVIGKKSRQSIPAMTSFMEPPTHWMPLPAPPCETCNGHGMIGGPSYYAPDEGGEPCPDCSPAAPTSHPIPTGATGDRDWELACDNCNGSGHVFVKHQVAERKTDVQEFKEECEGCDGRGFNIAFEDIPGIAEYVKSCRAAPAAGDALARAEMFRHQLAYERAKNERLLAILVGIHNLTLPAPVVVDGKTYAFTPPEAVEILRGLSDRIRSIPDEIAAIAQQSKRSKGGEA